MAEQCTSGDLCSAFGTRVIVEAEKQLFKLFSGTPWHICPHKLSNTKMHTCNSNSNSNSNIVQVTVITIITTTTTIVTINFEKK